MELKQNEYLKNVENNLVIFDSFTKMMSVIPQYNNIAVSISGGSDSDIILDMVTKIKCDTNIKYIWFDTGLEYQATKDHLKYLEEKYDIKIERYKAIKPIPLTCKNYGQPFLSKKISNNIARLQKHNFKWEDKPFEELYKEYPNCKAALRWWCNEWGKSPTLNINCRKYLKEFMIANPPTFKISDLCCEYAKKKVSHKFSKENSVDLEITGVRKSEGGIRSTAYKTCFDNKEKEVSTYRPIFWYLNSDKQEYERMFNVVHSKCYTEYGLKRTGCAGCPFGKDFEFELEVIKQNEPKLYIAVNNIFKNSYEYTRNYNHFKDNFK